MISKVIEDLPSIRDLKNSELVDLLITSRIFSNDNVDFAKIISVA
jgi:hypothetical protein